MHNEVWGCAETLPRRQLLNITIYRSSPDGLLVGGLCGKSFIGASPTTCAPPRSWSITFYTSSSLVKNFVQSRGDGCLT